MKLVRSLRKDLAIVFICAIVSICVIDFWLAEIPEVFHGAYKVGQIFYKLCMSYISAFIFYFLVVHIKQQKDKQNLYSYVANKVDRIIGDACNTASNITSSSNITLAEKYPSKEELEIICKSINPNGNAPLLLGRSRHDYANWVQYFDYQKSRTTDSIEKIFSKMPFLDTKLVSILARIEDNRLFVVISFIINHMPVKNQDFTAFQDSFFTYFELIKELEIYADKNLQKYK